MPTAATVVAGLAVAGSCHAVAGSCCAVAAAVSCCAAVEGGGGAVHGHDGHVAAVATVDRLNHLDKLFKVSTGVLLGHVGERHFEFIFRSSGGKTFFGLYFCGK